MECVMLYSSGNKITTTSYKQDRYIHIVDDKFETDIYHKVNDFDFKVVIYPFPKAIPILY